MLFRDPAARLIDAASGGSLTGSALDDAMAGAAAWLDPTPAGAVFMSIRTTINAVAAYLGVRAAGRPVALFDPRLDAATFAMFVDRYRPAVVIHQDDAPVPAGYQATHSPVIGPAWVRADGGAAAVHPDLAVLLATSGSTGDPKLVRLSRAAIEANTASIVKVLDIRPGAVTMTTLPFFYSYGMSVLNTYLHAGGTVIVTDQTLLDRGFWEDVDRYAVTSLALVPSHFQMLRRLRFDAARHPTLRTLTQAGGRMDPSLIVEAHGWMSEVGGQLFIMYGQTEGGPRLTTLPADDLPASAGSVGPALPGGRLSIKTEDGQETTAPGVSGEVIYRGPNVMMGYANRADDLASGDDLGGRLATGDLGRLDERGYLSLEGRQSRIGKVFGVRLNLDDIERWLAGAERRIAVTAADEAIVIWTESSDVDVVTSDVRQVAAKLHLHWTGFRVRTIDEFPLLPSGKVDYRQLEAEV